MRVWFCNTLLLLAAVTAAPALGVSSASAQDDLPRPTETTPTPTETTPTPAETTPTPTETTPEPSGITPAAAQTPPPTTANVAPPPSSTPLAETTAPGVELLDLRHDLESARRHGLRLTLRLTEPATVRADVLLHGGVVDRELRMCALPAAGPGDSLAKVVVWQASAGSFVVRVPFNVPSRRTLRKFLKIAVRVRIIATDVSGNSSTTVRPVSLRRP